MVYNMDDPCDLRHSMNLIETLICEVAKRPLLWDKYDNDYNNRLAMDSEWEKIANMLNKDKDYVKQKWRNLRDQFQRESKKVKVPFDKPIKPYIEYYRGKWIYFEQMLFLKHVAGNRKNSTFSTPEEVNIDEDDIKEEIIVFEDDMLAEHVTNLNSEPDIEKEQSITSSVEDVPIGLKVEIIEDDDKEPDDSRRKRKASELSNESAVPVKAKRQSVTETITVDDQSDIDDDLHFVKSLVPYLRKLPPLRKLIVRNEIQNLLIRESLCEKCKFGKDSSHHS